MKKIDTRLTPGTIMKLTLLPNNFSQLVTGLQHGFKTTRLSNSFHPSCVPIPIVPNLSCKYNSKSECCRVSESSHLGS